MRLKLRNRRGDTIVEVLIATAIVSLTLTGAYASANRSANATRTAQERGEALKWAETQVEQIKANAQVGNTFCYQASNLAYTPSTPCRTGPIPYKATVTQNPANSGKFKVVVQWDALGSGTNQVELDYVK